MLTEIERREKKARKEKRRKGCCTPLHSLGPLARLSLHSAPAEDLPRRTQECASQCCLRLTSDQSLCSECNKPQSGSENRELIRSQLIKGRLYPRADVLGLDPHCHQPVRAAAPDARFAVRGTPSRAPSSRASQFHTLLCNLTGLFDIRRRFLCNMAE